MTLESRATIGYSSNVIKEMAKDPKLELQTLVTGMHLMPELGHTVDTLMAAGVPTTATVPMPEQNGRCGWAAMLGDGITGFARVFEELKPDIILISGDRIESFGLCVAAAFSGIPVAHIQAGDKSGHIDDTSRMAMAKLAHIHMAAGLDSVERLRRLGEEEFRIFDVGAPQLDDMVARDYRASTVMIEGNSFDLETPYILLLQHPLMVERDEAHQQMRESLAACLSTGMPVIWIYPNSDPGFHDILRLIEKEERAAQIIAVSNLERDTYLMLLANAACLVGNSSSGILEAPSFKVPVINIGDRQRGRPQATNILNCGPAQAPIRKAIDTALGDLSFKTKCAEAVNLFGDGKSSPRINKILREIVIDKRLLDKKTTY